MRLLERSEVVDSDAFPVDRGDMQRMRVVSFLGGNLTRQRPLSSKAFRSSTNAVFDGAKSAWVRYTDTATDLIREFARLRPVTLSN